MEKKKTSAPPSVSLLLRVLAGGYLVYLAWQLFRDAQGDGKILLAAVVFGVVGAALAVWSGWTLIRSEYFWDKPEREETEDQEEPEEQDSET